MLVTVVRYLVKLIQMCAANLDPQNPNPYFGPKRQGNEEMMFYETVVWWQQQNNAQGTCNELIMKTCHYIQKLHLMSVSVNNMQVLWELW